MPQSSTPKDIEKMIEATATAMALAEYRCGTPRMVKLYMDDARQVLLRVAITAKRMNWTPDELVRALKPSRRPTRYRDTAVSPLRRSGP